MKASGILVAVLLGAGAAACGVPSAVGVPVPVAVTPPPPTTSTSVVAVPQTVYVPQPAYAAPADTVVAYYDALNRRDFTTAWSLGGSRIAGGGGYDKYVNGFATTSWDTLTVTDVRGSTVSVALSAAQTDGSTRIFTGTYTVSGDVITGSHMTRTK